jgi:hypothetical protein
LRRVSPPIRILALVVLATACASTAEPSKPVVEFPSVQSLAAIEQKTAPPVAMAETAAAPPDWTVEASGASTELFQPWTPSSPSENTLARAYQRSGRPTRFTRAMACAARELGRFVLQTGGKGAPAEGLQSFILGACGLSTREVGVVPFGGDAPATASDQQVLAAWEKSFTADLAKRVPADVTEVGLWFGRARGKAVAVVAYDRLRARFAPFSLVPNASNEVVFEGEVSASVGYFNAYVNRGRYAAEACFVDPSVPRPRFRVTCEMDPADATAWVQLLYAEPRRVLGFPFAQFLLRRDPTQPLVHRPEPYAPPHPISSASEFSAVAIAQLNQVRQTASLPPVKLAAAQSLTAGGLASHYFAAAVANKERDVMDTVALGVMAGWQVSDGMIRDASFVANLIPRTHDVGTWLTESLTMPIGRSTLLDPQIETIALGPVMLDKPEATGALVSGYRFYRNRDHTRDVTRLFMRVAAARRRLNLSKPGRLAQISDVMTSELAQVNGGSSQPMTALQNVLETGVSRFGSGMKGYVVEATSLDALEIPEEILKQPTLHLEIGVTHHKAPGAAWGQLVILVAYADYGESI